MSSEADPGDLAATEDEIVALRGEIDQCAAALRRFNATMVAPEFALALVAYHKVYTAARVFVDRLQRVHVQSKVGQAVLARQSVLTAIGPLGRAFNPDRQPIEELRPFWTNPELLALPPAFYVVDVPKDAIDATVGILMHFLKLVRRWERFEEAFPIDRRTPTVSRVIYGKQTIDAEAATIESALHALSGRTREIIGFLAKQPERKAHIDRITANVWNAKGNLAPRRDTTRKAYNRARENLDEKDIGVRLAPLSDSVASLIIETRSV